MTSTQNHQPEPEQDTPPLWIMWLTVSIFGVLIFLFTYPVSLFMGFKLLGNVHYEPTFFDQIVWGIPRYGGPVLALIGMIGLTITLIKNVNKKTQLKQFGYSTKALLTSVLILLFLLSALIAARVLFFLGDLDLKNLFSIQTGSILDTFLFITYILTWISVCMAVIFMSIDMYRHHKAK